MRIAFVALFVAAPGSGAHADNQHSFFLGNIAAICGGAVAVVGDDGASFWYNTLRVRDYPRLLRGDLPDRPDEADPVLDLGSSELLTVPSALAYVRRLTPDLSLFGYDSPVDGDPTRGNGAVVQEDAIDRFGFNVFLGAQWQVSDEWALGLVLRSPLIQVHESFERRRFRLGADVAPDGSATVVTELAPLRLSGFDAAVHFNFAGTVALAWTPNERAFLSLELDIQPGSRDQGIVRELVWNLRLGGVVPLSDTFRVGAGLFTDRSWEPEPTEAWIDRVHYYGIATGLYFETPLALAAGAGADSLVFTSVFGLRYAVGFGETLRAVADPSGVHTDPSTTRIDLTFHEISLHVGSGLRF